MDFTNKLFMFIFTLTIVFYRETKGQAIINRHRVPSNRISSTSTSRNGNRINSRTENSVLNNRIIPDFNKPSPKNINRHRNDNLNSNANIRSKLRPRNDHLNVINRIRSQNNNLQSNSILPGRRTSLRALSPTAASRLRSTSRVRPTSRTRLVSPTSPSRIRTTARSRISSRIRPTLQPRVRGTTLGSRASNRIISRQQSLRLRRTCPVLRCPDVSNEWCIIPSYFRLTNGRLCRGCGANRCGGQGFEDRWRQGFG